MVVITEIFAIIKGVCIGPLDKFPQFPSLSYLKLGHIARRRPLENRANNINVLVINAGSSSLKYQLLNPATGALLAKGLCERIGIDGKFTYKPQVEGKQVLDAVDVAMPTHSEAIKAVMDALVDKDNGVIGSMQEIDAVGHRVVHGGEAFAGSVLITDEVMKALEECIPRGPRATPPHNPGHNAGPPRRGAGGPPGARRLPPYPFYGSFRREGS